jgi:L-fuculose-phosphate aldolase
MSQEVEELRRQCFLGARFLWQELRELYGHVSCRLPNGEGFLLMMVRVPMPPCDPDELMAFDYEGNKLEGEQPPPYEIDMHTEIYRRRPDVQSIVHSHPHMATALSTTGKTVFALNHQTRRYGKGIPLFKGDFITDRRLGVELAECLGDQPAALMKGHGVVVVGRHVPDAVTNALYLEQAAKQQIWASAVGTPQVLPDRLLVEPEEHRGGGPMHNNLWRQLLWEWETGGRVRRAED